MFFPRHIEAAAAAPSSVQLLPGRCSRQLRGSVSECSTTPARGLTDKTQTLCVHRSRRSLQTPSSWAEETRGRRSGGGGSGHKRSASWGSAEHLREASTLTRLSTRRPYRVILPSQIIPLAPLRPQVAKLRHQLQKRSRHAPPSSGCELSNPPLQAGHAAGITQVTVPLRLCFL